MVAGVDIASETITNRAPTPRFCVVTVTNAADRYTQTHLSCCNNSESRQVPPSQWWQVLLAAPIFRPRASPLALSDS